MNIVTFFHSSSSSTKIRH
ncbi:hypothetical protein CP082626L3_0304A, partial [Chlamydia psittaci 08-2626_L3]